MTDEIRTGDHLVDEAAGIAAPGWIHDPPGTTAGPVVVISPDRPAVLEFLVTLGPDDGRALVHADDPWSWEDDCGGHHRPPSIVFVDDAMRLPTAAALDRLFPDLEIPLYVLP